MKTFGVNLKDADATFRKIDRDGGGMILFDEFCEWAMTKGMDHDRVK